MFKKLRIQFIAIIMASVAVVLVVVFTGICWAEYQRSATEVEEALAGAINRASENGHGMGQGPAERSNLNRNGSDNSNLNGATDSTESGNSNRNGSGNGGNSNRNGSGNGGNSNQNGSGNGRNSNQNGSSDSTGSGSGNQNGSSDSTGSGNQPLGPPSDLADMDNPSSEGEMDTMPSGHAPEGDGDGIPQIGKRDGMTRSVVPVAVYSLTETTTLSAVRGYTSASIDSEVLASAAERIESMEDGSGTFSDLGLHYKKSTVETTTYVAFADISTTENWQSLAITLFVAGLGVLAVFFVISLFFSRWALKPVHDAWNSQRQFVADASHDLKTPLTVILANMSILLKHPDRSIASESQWIESTQIEAQQMQGLVNEMLELARVEDGQQTKAAFAPVDLSDLVDGETLMFDSIALERNCQFDCQIEEGISVNGDAQQLKKMVGTLVENAFKYVNAGGMIDVRLRKSGKTIQLSVRNTGAVISPEDLPHIFDRFYRTDKARTSGAGGYGLGLAIARGIAQAHGGDITCTSSEAEGTTFVVTLPAG